MGISYNALAMMPLFLNGIHQVRLPMISGVWGDADQTGYSGIEAFFFAVPYSIWQLACKSVKEPAHA